MKKISRFVTCFIIRLWRLKLHSDIKKGKFPSARKCYDSSLFANSVKFGIFFPFVKIFNYKEINGFIKTFTYDIYTTSVITGAFATEFLAHGHYEMARALSETAMGYNDSDLHLHRISTYANEHLQNKVGELDAYLKESFCAVPFNHFETVPSRAIHMCCPGWLPRPIGTLGKSDWKSLWRGVAAEEIRASILDGSFKYCSPTLCPVIRARKLEKKADLTPERLEQYRTQLPTFAVLSHDQSCNLSCPSCRKERIVVDKTEQAAFDSLTEGTLMPVMDSAHEVKITGSGDPFGSIHFRQLLANYCRTHSGARKLLLHTNGVLFDEPAWNSLKLEGHVKTVYISMDAAKEDTYKVVRRGGDFKRLLKNLEFLSALRQANKFDNFCLLFVVQKRNYREMASFIELGRRFKVDKVYFSRIHNWGTFSIDEFLDNDIARHDHPEHEDLVQTLKTLPVDDPIVELGNLTREREESVSVQL